MITSTRRWVADSVVRVARSEGREALLEHEGLQVVREMGLRVPHHLVAEDVAALGSLALDEFPGPRVVVKALSVELAHKTEHAAVVVVPRNTDAVVRAAREMESGLGARFAPDGYLVEEYVPHRMDPGGELLLAVRWTREFGAIVTLGLGGTAVEFLAGSLPAGEGVASFAAGLDPERLAPGLRGRVVTRLATGAVRGAQPGPSLTRLALLLEDAMAFAEVGFPDPFLEVEVNPLAFTTRGPMALDVLVRLSPAGLPPTTSRRHPSPAAMEALLHPESVAIVGVSETLNPGRMILRNLLSGGRDPRTVTVVKPDLDELEGCPCVPDLASLGGTVDLLVVAVPAGCVPELVEDVVRVGRARSVVVIPGGLGELEGSEARAERISNAVQAARAVGEGPVVNGGNCLGVRSMPGRVNTFFVPDDRLAIPDTAPAPLAVVSQSGGFAAARASRLADLNPRHLVSVGNQLDLTVGDWLDHLADDPGVEVYACYVEGFRPLDGLRFLRAAERITASGRSVVLYRAGRSPEGARAAASHCASVAGDWAVTRDLAKAAGVLFADGLDDFDGLTRLALAMGTRRPGGTGLGAMSNAGFQLVTFADGAAALRFPDFSPSTTEHLSDLLEARNLTGVVGVRNPMNVSPMIDDQGFAETVEAILDDPVVDAAVVGCVPVTAALTTEPADATGADVAARVDLASRLIELWKRTRQPWAVAVEGGAAYDAFVQRLRAGGVPTFRGAERTMRLLAHWMEWRGGPSYP